jgi:excisionase family DNA binding protein
MPFRRFQRNRGAAQVEIEPKMAEQAPVETLGYTVREAAALLGVDTHNLYVFVNKGTIPSVRLGRKILIPKTAPIFQALREGTGGVDAINTP